jgi:hypothetical protein
MTSERALELLKRFQGETEESRAMRDVSEPPSEDERRNRIAADERMSARLSELAAIDADEKRLTSEQS